ncbi:Leucine-rich repeat neuronal protein 4 Neuronal leucine-rich repeat protein 4 [Channa argus]|uniref:Leucine-rich repeat neuronal protein 4 Neuronal leucine-rich repeat protein 4 n=1 Tax=Channa argus TaxID=215402 RepID=A0A6G1PUM0_CHAAH|nr:Leucine-rich repeat neuronal protein 4 Neuronal leucine-rich repeat protein 4 [Channa argus]KAK2904221.1 hypothetical protein Q8A73_010878 [Channa argus]
MMSLLKNLAMVFLVGALSPLHSHIFTHAASTSPPVTRSRIIFLTAQDTDDDYGEGEFNNESSPPVVMATVNTAILYQEPKICKYNPCQENQELCAQLSARTKCICPGVSGADEPPHAPRIQALLPISEGNDTGNVEVQWCAPSSVVFWYRVLVEGRNSDAYKFGVASRRAVVGSLEVGTKVCVEALNNAGHSTPSVFSCKRYDPPKPDNLTWIIGGGVILLLLLTIGSVILWKCKMCKKGKRDSTEGLGNPSYTTGGTL